MIKAKHIEAWGFGHAVRGMRNSFASWDKSDTVICDELSCEECRLYREYESCVLEKVVADAIVTPVIGENDMALMQKLYKEGTSARKFMRQIFVSMDITAPLYFWKQMDTYKVGVTMNSASTMHSIMDKEFTLNDFSRERLGYLPYDDKDNGKIYDYGFQDVLKHIVKVLNIAREGYVVTKDKRYWWQIIQLLPESYNQLRTVTMNYEVAATIINQRRGHKLDEWNTLIDIFETKLPYLKEIMA